ncbi:unnamed protein product [Ectocarpus sp. 13 AM-2016]
MFSRRWYRQCRQVLLVIIFKLRYVLQTPGEPTPRPCLLGRWRPDTAGDGATRPPVRSGPLDQFHKVFVVVPSQRRGQPTGLDHHPPVRPEADFQQYRVR